MNNDSFSGRGGGRGRHSRFGHGPFGFEGGAEFGHGHSGEGHHGRGHHGRGRRRRQFDQAELQSLLLSLIAEQPRHGYELIREIESLSGGEYSPSPGVVYPALTFMEEAGLIATAASASSRKSYEATETGRERAEADAELGDMLRKRLSALAQVREKTDPAPVRRAMHSLKSAVLDRLSQEGANRALTLEVAGIIDEATAKIERIEP